ncbi:hypothetical protein CYLTODRAFT_421845 [Cylindrobasidium torrendii FP15055 ss-10]|uniref:F-box domain-containing protein n=1 Tax=Cylindrobasidium torrendii FP15055 ss-10 TaxID=1314674 RepID=A0A0D7BD84_9AGAR|nr:hypothetical protein CYLTODRAFT_421845 [Cylindrobasidium torrendii FP15055 ss-10]
MTMGIQSFPVELLTEIFQQAQTHDTTFATQDQVEGNAQVALDVSRVCHSWRFAALGFPALWVYIPWCGYPAGRLELLSEQIQRSKGWPLVCFLALPRATHIWFRLRNIVANHLPTARQLTILECDEAYFSMILRGNSPNLRSLSIQTSSRFNIAPQQAQLGFEVYSFDVLKHVCIDGIGIMSISPIVKKAEVVSAATMPLPVHTILLPSSSSLSSLTIGPDVHVKNILPGSLPVLLPALRELDTVTHPRVSHWITAPHLQSLQLRVDMPQNLKYFVSNLLPTWAANPLTEVEHLGIKLAPLGRQVHGCPSFGRLFSAFPSVRYMRWEVHSPTEAVLHWARRLDAWDAVGSDARRWPNLQSITMNNEEMYSQLLEVLSVWRKCRLAVINFPESIEA